METPNLRYRAISPTMTGCHLRERRHSGAVRFPVIWQLQARGRIWITSRWEAWLDESGAAAGKPANQAATLLARSFGWQCSLHGTIVIVGLDKDTAPAALSPDQADAILRKIRAPAGQPGR
jgi:hypothetical protein